MKLLLTLCLLLFVHVWAQQELDCTGIACTELVVPECEGSCRTLSGCCETCCETECVDCLISPCANYSCVGHPEYTCREDYCGGCNRNWFDGDGVRTHCLAEISNNQDPCATVKCAAVDESECTGCGITREGCCDVCCPTECAECGADPCEGYSCQYFPGLTCRANYCGGCNREWFTSTGERTECSVEIFGEHPCALVDCMNVNVEECHQAGSCGLSLGDGCCSQCCEGPCAMCAFDPCEGYVCDDNAAYTCQGNYCGGCHRQWTRESGDLVHCFNERQLAPSGNDSCLDAACPLIFLNCSCGETIVDCCPSCCECDNTCERDPCELLSCESQPELRCRPNHCTGECAHEWFDTNDMRVTCDREIFLNNTVTEPPVEQPEWFFNCRTNDDCSLRNVDQGFACCDYEGRCDLPDYSQDSWVSVNDLWWRRRHDQCNRFEYCGAIVGCPIRPALDVVYEPYSAYCVNSQCVKQKSLDADEYYLGSESDNPHSIFGSFWSMFSAFNSIFYDDFDDFFDDSDETDADIGTGTNSTAIDNGTGVNNGTDINNGTNSTDIDDGTGNTNGTDIDNGTNSTDIDDGTDIDNGTGNTNGTDINNGTDIDNGTNSTDIDDGTDINNGTDIDNGTGNTNGTDIDNGTNSTDIDNGTDIDNATNGTDIDNGTGNTNTNSTDVDNGTGSTNTTDIDNGTGATNGTDIDNGTGTTNSTDIGNETATNGTDIVDGTDIDNGNTNTTDNGTGVTNGVDGTDDGIDNGIDGTDDSIDNGIDGADDGIDTGIDGADDGIDNGIDGTDDGIDNGIDGTDDSIDNGINGADEGIDGVDNGVDTGIEGVDNGIDTGIDGADGIDNGLDDANNGVDTGMDGMDV